MNTKFLIYLAMMAVGIAVLAALFMRDVKKSGRKARKCKIREEEDVMQ